MLSGHPAPTSAELGLAPAGVLLREARRRWPQTADARVEATIQAARLLDRCLRDAEVVTAPPGSARASEQREARALLRRVLSEAIADLLVGEHWSGE